MNRYIFRHPDLKMRPESFGGLVQTETGIYILGHKEFDALSSFYGYKGREQLEKELDVGLLEKFLTIGSLLEIDERAANAILKKRG